MGVILECTKPNGLENEGIPRRDWFNSDQRSLPFELCPRYVASLPKYQLCGEYLYCCVVSTYIKEGDLIKVRYLYACRGGSPLQPGIARGRGHQASRQYRDALLSSA